jgi:hypothetical protein
MPYDPNSPRNPLPPLNDGYPDDWHVPPSAQDDSFPDDWYVPPSAQPNAANIGFTAPPGSIAAYWSRLADQSDPSNVGAPPESSRRSSNALLPRALQGFFSGLAQPAVGSIDHPAYLVPLADKRKDPRNLDLFDERAFGNTPPLGSAAPRLIPPTGNPGPRPAAALAQSPPAQAPSAPRASPQAQPTLPGSPPPSGGRGGEPSVPTKAGALGAGGLVDSPDSNWRQLVENIERVRDARAQGGAQLPAAISAALPKYDGTTYGILITNEGDVVPLQSGPPDPRYSNYAPAKHVEGKAAIWIRDHGSSGGVVYHNNTEGTCGYCVSQVPTLLPEGARLRIVPPADAVPKNSQYTAAAIDRVGNERLPNPPAQADFFTRQP